MKIINLTQGSPEWHAHRAAHYNASDAPAMMGISPYKSRDDLVREYATGIRPEVDPAQQRRFDEGHRAEALARTLAEKIIGEELFPVVGMEDDGRYSASFDGLTMLEDTAFEHKTLNAGLRAAIRQQGGNANDFLAPTYQMQLEHQCMVCPAIERVLFMASKWADDDTLIEERHCWYKPDLALRQRIIAGWAQFEADVAAYTPEPSTAPAPTGRAPETLPALRIEMTGAVTASNLEEFKTNALSVLSGINRNLQTDADFADAEKTVKWCGEVESRIKAAKENALSQTASIEAAFRVMDDVSAEVRRVRLDLEKLVEAEKKARREAIVIDATSALREHVESLNKRLGKPYMPKVPADFVGSIKGKKSIDSMSEAVSSELARAKIAANEIADRIQINMRAIDEAGLPAMFGDVATLVLKEQDDLQAIISARQHAAEAALENLSARKAEKQATAEAATAAQANPVITPAPSTDQVVMLGPIVHSAPKHDTGARITLGQINTRIAPLLITVAGLSELGFSHVAKDKAAFLFRESDFSGICDAIARNVMRAKLEHSQPLAA